MSTWQSIFIPVLIYAACVILACLLWPLPLFLTICYAALSLILFTRWHSRRDLIFYCVAFVCGPLGEFFAVRFGAWQYAKPFYLIPLWLPFLWGIAALFIKKLSEALASNSGPPTEN
jgi:hypothetical protein